MDNQGILEVSNMMGSTDSNRSGVQGLLIDRLIATRIRGATVRARLQLCTVSGACVQVQQSASTELLRAATSRVTTYRKIAEWIVPSPKYGDVTVAANFNVRYQEGK